MRRSRTSAPRLPPPPSDAGCRSRTGVCCCPPSNEAHSARATTPHPSENMPICAYCNTCLEDHGCPAGTTSCVCCIRCLLWVELMSSLESAESGRDMPHGMAHFRGLTRAPSRRTTSTIHLLERLLPDGLCTTICETRLRRDPAPPRHGLAQGVGFERCLDAALWRTRVACVGDGSNVR